jgi:hypothetical protein
MANNNGSLPSSVKRKASYVSENGRVLQNISGRSNPGFANSAISIHNGLSQLSNFSNRSGNFQYANEAHRELDEEVEAQAAAEALAEAEANAAQLQEAGEVQAAEAHLEELAAAEAYAGNTSGALPANWWTRRVPFNQRPRITYENMREYPSLKKAMKNGLVPKGPSKKTRPKRKSRRTRKTRRRNNRR